LHYPGLTEKELKQLNLIVSMYLDFAELQAMEEIPMKMKDWIERLDEFLKTSRKKILNNFGNTSLEKAINKAKFEYKKYREAEDMKYISDFDREMKKLLKSEKKDEKDK